MEEQGTGFRAADRCLDSCDHMAAIIRGVKDVMLESTNLLFTYCIFVVTPFYLSYSRIMACSMPNKVFLLVHALRICIQRWPLAQQLHSILERAVAEFAGTSTAQNLLLL
ncbi:hypothetical protein EDB80DRAFT_875734 [Ilyonectria destructans]|nr:hypothetical protein EDB80DRAFT_875734 [Ilyonectria destructans]